MRPIQLITPSYSAAVANYLAASQKPAGAIALTLTTTLTLTPPRFVTITSDADDTGTLFTVVGLGLDGVAQTETIVGPNAAAATSTLVYASVSSISVSIGTTGNITAGFAQSGLSDWIPLDIYTPNQVTTVSATLTGTANYSIQYTNEDPWDHTFQRTAVAHPTAALTGATASQTASSTTLMRALRYKINSGTGTLRLTIVQQSTA
jgi:hypothetical protein